MLDQLYSESNTDSALSNSDVSLLEGYASGLAIDPRPLTPSALHSASIDEAWLSEWQTTDSYQHLLTGDLFPFDIAAQPSASSSVSSPVAYDTETSDFLTGSASAFFSSDDILSPQSATGSWYQQGSLKADRFTVNLNEALTVISGNGNVEYGYGEYDYLDLSNLFSNSIASWSPAESEGVLFDTGNGARVFDSLVLTNGSQVLFEGLDSVQFADGSIDLSVDPNDPYFEDQWSLHMMGVQNAWRFTQGSAEVLVGVQDSGLGYNGAVGGFHPDIDKTLYLPDNVIDEFFREVGNGSDGPQPDSHGTSIQSIISAASNNGVGMSGINWNSNVFHIDVLDGNAGDLSKAEAAQEMIDYANQRGQKLVVNMSLGGPHLDQAFANLVANNQENALFVIANGNEGRDSLSQPAALGYYFDNVVGVGASWGNNSRLGDRINYSNYGSGISLMGPSEVIAATASPSASGTQFSWTDTSGGTSSAAPNVAGVASLIWSIDPRFSAVQVHQIMQETAYDLGVQGYDYETGFGFVNADAAVRRAMAIARTSNPFSMAMTSAATEPLAESASAYTQQLTESVVVETSIANQPMYKPASGQSDWFSPVSFSTAVNNFSEIAIDTGMTVLETASKELSHQAVTLQAERPQTVETFQLPLSQILDSSFDFAV